MHQQIAQIDEQLARLRAIEQQADQEAFKLRFGLKPEAERLGSLNYEQEEDSLLTRKFRTRAGQSLIALERILLQIDGVDTLGGLEDIRLARKQLVNKINELIAEAESVVQTTKQLIELQDAAAVRKEEEEKPAPKTEAEEEEKMDEIKEEEEEAVTSDEEEEEAEEEAEADDEENEQPQLPAQPKVQVGENRFAYILDISFPMASQGRVALAKDGTLTVALPNLKMPLEYSVGYDVDYNRVSMRPTGPHGLRIILPKQFQRAQRSSPATRYRQAMPDFMNPSLFV